MCLFIFNFLSFVSSLHSFFLFFVFISLCLFVSFCVYFVFAFLSLCLGPVLWTVCPRYCPIHLMDTYYPKYYNRCGGRGRGYSLWGKKFKLQWKIEIKKRDGKRRKLHQNWVKCLNIAFFSVIMPCRRIHDRWGKIWTLKGGGNDRKAQYIYPCLLLKWGKRGDGENDRELQNPGHKGNAGRKSHFSRHSSHFSCPRVF